MIKHIVMWKFHSNVGENDKDEMVARLKSLANSVPQLRSISAGLDLSHKERSWDIAIYSEFDTVEDLHAYAVHPEHIKVAEFIKTLACEVAAVDFE